MPASKPSDGLTQFLASLGGIPALILIVLGVLALLALSAIGVGVAEFIAVKLGRFIDQQDALLAFAVVCVLLAVLLLVAPVCRYVMVGQARRLEIIKGYYTPNIIARYFDQFWAGRAGYSDLIDRWKNQIKLDPDAERNPPRINGEQLTVPQVQAIRSARQRLDRELQAKFDELLAVDFGFGMYLIPLVLLVAVAGIVMYFGFLGGISLAKACGNGSCGSASPIAVPLFGLKLDLVSVAAIFGAYTWVASDSITRNYQATFHPSDLSWYALRLIVAIPLGEAISTLALSQDKAGAVAPGAAGAFLAFVISMFSFDSITKYLTAAANRLSGGAPGGTPAERDDLIVKLPGVDEETARRLSAEGVSTIAEMISVDPVRISIRSGLSFDFILNLVDAAILWTYVGGKILILREFGFKGASNVLMFYELTRVKTSRAEDLTRLATEFERRDKAAKAAQTNKDKMLASLRMAELALEQNATLATAQTRLREIAGRLQDPAVTDAEKAALQNEQTQLRQNVAPWTMAEATLKEQLEAAKANYAAADSQYTDAVKKADLANADLEVAFKARDTLMTDLAEKASMKASGISNIIQQLTRDQYADFILRLMSVLPVARS